MNERIAAVLACAAFVLLFLAIIHFGHIRADQGFRDGHCTAQCETVGLFGVVRNERCFCAQEAE